LATSLVSGAGSTKGHDFVSEPPRRRQDYQHRTIEGDDSIVSGYGRPDVRVVRVGLDPYPIDPFDGAPRASPVARPRLGTGVLVGILGNSALMSDLIHPNDAGDWPIALGHDRTTEQT
jgi:hypothetical protein